MLCRHSLCTGLSHSNGFEGMVPVINLLPEHSKKIIKGLRLWLFSDEAFSVQKHFLNTIFGEFFCSPSVPVDLAFFYGDMDGKE